MAFELFVNGTLMRGLELHPNMGNSEFLGEFQTARCYRLHTINDIHPGMYRLEENESGGVQVRGELYLVEEATWQAIEAGEPPYLYRGRVVLEDGREVYGILYPRQLAVRYPDISEYGGWREYRAASRPKAYSGES
jgi:AGZA family xanthine/uracil permease-like MFS transporter